jgi:hypothetical protein
MLESAAEALTINFALRDCSSTLSIIELGDIEEALFTLCYEHFETHCEPVPMGIVFASRFKICYRAQRPT